MRILNSIRVAGMPARFEVELKPAAGLLGKPAGCEFEVDRGVGGGMEARVGCGLRSRGGGWLGLVPGADWGFVTWTLPGRDWGCGEQRGGLEVRC